MVKRVIFSKFKSVEDVLRMAGVSIDSTKVRMIKLSADDIIFEFPDDVPDAEIEKLSAFLKKFGFERNLNIEKRIKDRLRRV